MSPKAYSYNRIYFAFQRSILQAIGHFKQIICRTHLLLVVVYAIGSIIRWLDDQQRNAWADGYIAPGVRWKAVSGIVLADYGLAIWVKV